MFLPSCIGGLNERFAVATGLDLGMSSKCLAVISLTAGGIQVFSFDVDDIHLYHFSTQYRIAPT